jgi:GTP-binding protein EngB required for normal cell division
MIGHRQIQESEEKFFKEVNVGDIPVIAVFTHFDRIEDDHEFALMKKHQRIHPNTPIPPDVAVNAHARAVRDYDEIYRPNLEKVTGRRSKVAFRRVSMPEGIIH